LRLSFDRVGRNRRCRRTGAAGIATGVEHFAAALARASSG